MDIRTTTISPIKTVRLNSSQFNGAKLQEQKNSTKNLTSNLKPITLQTWGSGSPTPLPYQPIKQGQNIMRQGNFHSISQVKNSNASNGFYFFSKGAMRGFNSRVHDTLYNGCVFVTSEKNDMPYMPPQPRVYTVRVAMDDGSIETYGSMGDYATRAQAHTAARELAKELAVGSMVYCRQSYGFVDAQNTIPFEG